MKYWNRFLAVLAAAFVLPAAAVDLNNGDFARPIRNGKVPGWSLALHGNPLPAIEPVKGVPGATRAALFRVEKSAPLNGSLEQRLKLEPNTRYYALMWTKSEQPDGAYLEVARLDAARKKKERFAFGMTGKAGEWQPVCGEFTTGATGEVQFCMRFRLDSSFVGNRVWLTAPWVGKEKPELPEKSGLELVPTFENCSLYFYPEKAEKPEISGADALKAEFREAGSSEWQAAYPPSFDPGEISWRGSLVNLKPDREYEVRLQLQLRDGSSRSVTGRFRTWSTTPPPFEEVRLTQKQLEKGELVLTRSGRPERWIKYTAAPGTVLTGKKGENSVILLRNARYVWFDGLTIRGGGARHGLELANSDHVRVTNCDISDFGRLGPRRPEKDGKFYLPDGQYINYDAGIYANKTSNLVIERNYIHDPRSTANGWFFSHPAGPQGIYLRGAGGTVIRFNDFVGSDPHRWNDAVESNGNGQEQGGPYRDCDIYGNLMFLANDDGIELDGGQMNIRTYLNRFEGFHCAISTAPCLLGPSYVFRNLMVHPGDFYANPNTVIKNNYSVDGKGQIHVFNNTWHAPKTASYTHYARKKLGAPYDQQFKGITRNNLMSAQRTYSDRVFEWKNDFAFDQFWSDDPADRKLVEKKHEKFQGIRDFRMVKPEFTNLETGDYRLCNPQPGEPIPNFTGPTVQIGAFQPDDGIRQLPYRPLPFAADTGELHFRSGGPVSRSFTVTSSATRPLRFRVRQNRAFDWFRVAPEAGVFAPGSTTKFTVTLLPKKMPSALLYKGLLLISGDDGMSRPVSVYADFREDAGRTAADAREMAEVPGPFPAGAEFTREFTIPADGVYYLLARVKPDAADREKIRFSIDGDEQKAGLVRPYSADWKWVTLTRTRLSYEPFRLKAGTHTLRMQFGNGLKLDRVVFLPRPELLMK